MTVSLIDAARLLAGADRRCRRCGMVLIHEDEIDTGCCDYCTDDLYEQSEERRDWDHWHQDDPPKDEPA